MTPEKLDYLQKLCSSPEYGIPEKDVAKVYELLSSMLSELPLRDVVGKPTNIKGDFKRDKQYDKLFAFTILDESSPIFDLFEAMDLLIGSNPGKFERYRILKEVDKASKPYLLAASGIMKKYINDTKPTPEPSSQKVEEKKTDEPTTKKTIIDEFVESRRKREEKNNEKKKE